jgi:aryl-alcohol dehydrogenase-like predicted oxidoreductase
MGRTGAMLSVVGFSGSAVRQEEQATADRIVAEAVQRGINYFDVAPSYGDAEERLGPALQPFR